MLAWHILRQERNTTTVASLDAAGAQRVAVTFDFWRDTDEKEAPRAYGESFFAKRGFAQVHVFAHWNHWFHVEEMERVLETIRVFTSGAQERILYGSSMGGFAALAFAERLRGTIAIAVTPQYSIDPAKGWDEPRFRADVRAIERYHASIDHHDAADPFRFEALDRVALPARTHLLYDPGFRPDVAHVEEIARHHDFASIHCPGGGHWPDLALRRAGLLSSVIAGAIDGTLEQPAVFPSMGVTIST